MAKEYFLPISEIEGAEAGSQGTIKFNGRVLPQSRNRVTGYVTCKIQGTIYYVHRLVASAFCLKKETDTEVNHKNEIRHDNRAVNLEWCEHVYNMNYGNVGRKISEAHSRPVGMFKDGKLVGVYRSGTECQKEHGWGHHVTDVIAGRMPSFHGYTFSFI